MSDSIRFAARRIKGEAIKHRSMLEDNKGTSRFNVGKMAGFEKALQIIEQETGIDTQLLAPVFDEDKVSALPAY